MKKQDEIQKDLDLLRERISTLSAEPFARNRKELIAYYSVKAETLAEVLGEEPESSAESMAEQLILNRNKRSVFRDIRDRVKNCTLCPLHESGKRCSLPGRGMLHVPILILTYVEPTLEQLEMLQTMMEHEKTVGAPTSMYHITYALKCSPSFSDFDAEDSLDICTEHTRDHIFLINPKVILAMGQAANRQLTIMQGKTLDDIRDSGYNYYHYPVVPTYGLEDIDVAENEKEMKRVKMKIWNDLKKVKDILESDNEG